MKTLILNIVSAFINTQSRNFSVFDYKFSIRLTGHADHNHLPYFSLEEVKHFP